MVWVWVPGFLFEVCWGGVVGLGGCLNRRREIVLDMRYMEDSYKCCR